MKILLVSATKFEIEPLLKSFKKVRAGKNLSTYSSGKHMVDVLITGIGMTATAFHLGKILHKKYDLAINVGVAGSFKKNIALGVVVNVVSDRFGDLGAEDGQRFLTLDEMGFKEVDPPAGRAGSRKSTRLPDGQEVKSQKIRRVLSGILKVKGITVNTVHGNTSSIKKIVQKFNPNIESMEGAAFFFACDHEKIPCIQIRGISNYVERRNKKNWELDLAVKNLCSSLEYFLKNI